MFKVPSMICLELDVSHDSQPGLVVCYPGDAVATGNKESECFGLQPETDATPCQYFDIFNCCEYIAYTYTQHTCKHHEHKNYNSYMCHSVLDYLEMTKHFGCALITSPTSNS